MPESASNPLPPQTEETLPLLKRRPFRMLSYSRFFSRLAQNAMNFALVLLIVDETGLAVMSSLLVLAIVIPSTVAGIAAGAAADVLPKRLLIVLGDLARAAVAFFFARGAQDVPSYFIAAIVISSLVPVATNAEGAIQPQLVAREELARANAISQAVGSAAQLIGLGVLTPFALRLLDSPDTLFVICAILYAAAAVSAVLIGHVRRPERMEVGGEAHHGAPWYAAGWRAIRADPAVMHAAIELTLISTTLIILGGLIPTYIGDTLGLPVAIGAVVLLPGALGVVLGLRIAGFLAHRVAHGLLSTAGFVGFVVMLLALTFVNQEASFLSGYGAFEWLDDVQIKSFEGGGVIAMAVMLPLGFSFALVSVAAQTVMNDRVPLTLQGRVGAAQAAMAAIASSVPVILAGLLADAVGVTAVMAIVAITISLAAIANVRGPRRERVRRRYSIG